MERRKPAERSGRSAELHSAETEPRPIRDEHERSAAETNLASAAVGAPICNRLKANNHDRGPNMDEASKEPPWNQERAKPTASRRSARGPVAVMSSAPPPRHSYQIWACVAPVILIKGLLIIPVPPAVRC